AEFEQDKGHFSEAGTLYRRATAIDPNFAQAWAGLTGLRKMTPDDAPWLREAQRVLNSKLPLRQEIQLRYAVGKYFDDLRDYPAAFSHFASANELTKRIAPRYDALMWEKQFEATTADSHALLRPGAAPLGAAASSRPVFIVGMPRSGTSLAEQ